VSKMSVVDLNPRHGGFRRGCAPFVGRYEGAGPLCRSRRGRLLGSAGDGVRLLSHCPYPLSLHVIRSRWRFSGHCSLS